MEIKSKSALVLNSIIAWSHQKVKIKNLENSISILALVSFSFYSIQSFIQQTLCTCFVLVTMRMTENRIKFLRLLRSNVVLHLEKMLDITNYQEKENQHQKEIPPHTFRMAIIKKSVGNTCWQGCGGKGMKLVQPL